MKNKIYYITRSYPPYQKGGGSLMRAGAVKHLQELGWNVIVIMPNYGEAEHSLIDNVWKISFPNSIRWSIILQRIGYYEDYLDPWVRVALNYLKGKVKKNDIVFTTSGSELGTIKLGSLLKANVACKFIVNFRDPLSYSIVGGVKFENRLHVSREKQEVKYIENADLVITSSCKYRDELKVKYPDLKEKIYNNYFGYINKTDFLKYNKKESSKLKIAYVGTMTSLQKPEILYEVYNRLNPEVKNKVQICYIGDVKGYKALQNIKDAIFIDSLEHKEFIKFMLENIDG